jgi:hypothetical protein
MPSHQL